MERESNYDNDGLDPLEEYFRNKKKVMTRQHISLQKNQKRRIIKRISEFVKG